MTESVIAQDATMKFNGVDVTRSTNSFNDLISGVTLSLSNTNEGSPATLTVAEDTGKVADRVEEFIGKYNEFKSLIQEIIGLQCRKTR